MSILRSINWHMLITSIGGIIGYTIYCLLIVAFFIAIFASMPVEAP
jgi:hypothetical protein